MSVDTENLNLAAPAITAATSTTAGSTTEQPPQAEAHGSSRTSRALLVALMSAASFGAAGAFGKMLFAAGWSPTAAVAMRIGIAALVLAVPTVLELRGRWHLLRSNARIIALYSVFGVAGTQLFYFLAIEHLSVGVALLLEYLSPTLLVLLAWVTTRRAPSRLTMLGAVTALLGLVLVLNIFGAITISVIGVVFGLGAAVCSATFFLVASEEPEDGLSPVALSGVGMALGVLPLTVLGVTGVLPMTATLDSVPLGDAQVSVFVPIIGLSLISAAFAYVAGVKAARMLGSRVASFVALSEVLFAVLFAWLFVGELPLPIQLAGGVLIVLGVVLVRAGERAESVRTS